jgi:DNA repair protein RadD
MTTLRPYQQDTINKLLSSQHQRSLVVMATGLGKTLIGLTLIRHYASHILYLAHTEELLLQPSRRLTIPHGILKANYPTTSHTIQFASIQTLARRTLHYTPALIIVDEAHRILSSQYQEVLSRYPRARVIGLTATPYRLSGEALPFDEIVETLTPIDAFTHNYLHEPTIYAPHLPDLTKARIEAGDYINTASLVGDPTTSYAKHALGLPTIVFASSVAHSKALQATLTSQGHLAYHLDGSLDSYARAKARDVLAQGGIVTNCDLLTEGFDYAPLQCVILARPTLSMGLHFQQIGRVMRTSPGKTQALILDHAGNTLRHGFPHDHHSFTLTGLAPSAPKPTARGIAISRCEACAFVYRPAPTCPSCGHAPAPPASTLSSQADSSLLARTKKERLPSPGEKAVEYERLLTIARFNGWKDGWADYRFKSKYGHFPAPVSKSRVRKLLAKS